MAVFYEIVDDDIYWDNSFKQHGSALTMMVMVDFLLGDQFSLSNSPHVHARYLSYKIGA